MFGLIMKTEIENLGRHKEDKNEQMEINKWS